MQRALETSTPFGGENTALKTRRASGQPINT